MRKVGFALFFVGLIATVVGFFGGCNSLFGFNGRHVIASDVLPSEVAFSRSFTPEPGRRYTLAIQVVFERESAPRGEGDVVHFEAKMPLFAQVTDSSHTRLVSASGWVDPNEPPSVLYNQALPERVAASRSAPELLVERLVGPFMSASTTPLQVDVNLGSDRVGAVPIVTRRMVLYDDALPPSIRNAFILGVGGSLVLLAGVGILLSSWLRARLARASRKRRA